MRCKLNNTVNNVWPSHGLMEEQKSRSRKIIGKINNNKK
jgi:hypothetical protein